MARFERFGSFRQQLEKAAEKARETVTTLANNLEQTVCVQAACVALLCAAVPARRFAPGACVSLSRRYVQANANAAEAGPPAKSSASGSGEEVRRNGRRTLNASACVRCHADACAPARASSGCPFPAPRSCVFTTKQARVAACLARTRTRTNDTLASPRCPR